MHGNALKESLSRERERDGTWERHRQQRQEIRMLHKAVKFYECCGKNDLVEILNGKIK